MIYWVDSFLVINFNTMTAPPSIKESDTILVEVLRNGFRKMIGTTTVQAEKSTITFTVTPQSLVVNAQTLYLFTITLNDKLASGGWLEIYFPSTVTLPSTINSISMVGTSMKSSPTVTVDLLQHKLTITSLNSSASQIPTQTFTITLGMITNPGSTKPSLGFNVMTYYQAGSEYLVASGTAGGITATAGLLRSSDVVIGKSSDVVLAGAVDYTISFVTLNEIPQNGVIKI